MKQFVILVTATNGVGHVNACIGATRALVRRGHRVVFVAEKAFQHTLAPLGYEEYIYTAKPEDDEEEPNSPSSHTPGEWMTYILLKNKVIGPYSPWEKYQNMIEFLFSPGNLQEFSRFNAAVQAAIDHYQPDIIHYDSGALLPAIYYSGIPWVRNESVNPIFFQLDPNLPPGGSGLAIDADLNKWHEFNTIRHEIVASKRFNKHFVEGLGYEPFPDDLLRPHTHSLTVYAYVEEINYDGIRQKNWFNLEVFNRNPVGENTELKTLVPEEFLNRTKFDHNNHQFSGKLIYITMGTMGSVDVELMKRLVAILADTPHKYIVSKGLRAADYHLPSNMWGEGYLPQIKLLRHVDLVLSHGGTNTVSESFAEGKPCIAMPLFSDQFDNAQRLMETGYGVMLDPYRVTKEELTNTIDKLLCDYKLHHRLAIVSKRIQAHDRHEQLADMIEQLAMDKKKQKVVDAK